MPEAHRRREVLATGGAALFGFLVAGRRTWATPGEAVQQGFTPEVLHPAQVAALQTLGDALVPGAAAAGVGAYVDAQLAAGDQSMLMAKYVGVPVEQQAGFYGAALDAVHQALEGLTAASLTAAMAGDAVPDWQGPPASYVFFVLRADALDARYGTQQGFADLAIPYSAHILPETAW